MIAEERDWEELFDHESPQTAYDYSATPGRGYGALEHFFFFFFFPLFFSLFLKESHFSCPSGWHLTDIDLCCAAAPAMLCSVPILPAPWWLQPNQSSLVSTHSAWRRPPKPALSHGSAHGAPCFELSLLRLTPQTSCYNRLINCKLARIAVIAL